MPTRRTLVSGALAAVLLAACTGVAPGGPKNAGVRRPVVLASGAVPPQATVKAPDKAPITVDRTLLPPGSHIISNHGGGVISNNGGGLVATTIAGRVTAPASLVSDSGGSLITDNGAGVVGQNGAGVVSNNGGGVVSSGGARLRLAQAGVTPSQGANPVKGAVVELTDAAGQALRTEAGEPVRALTDADGRYTFEGMLPVASNYLVGVSFAGGKERLEAIAPKGARRDADIDLVSTLATRYVIARYVGPAADRQATLDKLPPAVEAETRGKVGAALAAGAAPAPTDLTAATVVGAVEALRAKDPALDAQLEAVKRLLVAAGQSDLGEGQPALSVALPWIRGVVPIPGGGFWLNASQSRRVFRVGADGVLRAAAGASSASEALVQGKAATSAGLRAIKGLVPIDGGRLLIVEDRRVTRLEPQGTLTEVWPLAAGGVYAAGQAPDGATWIVDAAGCHRVAADGTRAVTHPFGAAEAAFIRRVSDFGQTAAGRLVLHAVPTATAPEHEVRSLDPATGAFEVLVAPGTAGVTAVAVDAVGRTYTQGADFAVRIREADGAERALVPAGVIAALQRGAMALGEDGKALWADRGEVYRLDGAAKALVAGTAGAVADEAGVEGLNRPAGLLVLPDGALLVGVSGEDRVLRIVDGKTSVFAGTGGITAKGDGGPAVDADLANPSAIRRDAAGNVYILTAGQVIRKVAPDGTISTAHTTPADTRIYDFMVSADGQFLYVTGSTLGPNLVVKAGRVARIATAGGGETTVYAQTEGTLRLHAILLGADGALHLVGGGELRRWTAEAGFATVRADASLTAAAGWRTLGRATFDTKGRLYYFTGAEADRLHRLDPATGVVTLVAGVGAPVLAGEGIDDSFLNGLSPSFDAAGDLLFCDLGHNQVKRVPAAAL